MSSAGQKNRPPFWVNYAETGIGMSDEEEVTVEETESQVLTAEYKDGQLQIVEVTPFEKGDEEVMTSDTHIVPEIVADNSKSDGTKYMQVLDTEKGLVQLDLLNLTLVRCDDGEESYRLVSHTDNSESDGQSDSTVTCVLQSGNSDGESEGDKGPYVVVQGEQGPLVFLQSDLEQNVIQQKKDTVKQKVLSPAEILEKAKALQKTKALMKDSNTHRRSRKRRSDLPPPHELLSSPNFKLFLYSCKLCSFKCNAIKELTAHKTSEHTGGSKWRGGGRSSAGNLQCARCPFRGSTHTQLMKHVQDKHHRSDESAHVAEVYLNSAEAQAADILVCGACGYESSSRPTFKKHIEEEHGASTC